MNSLGVTLNSSSDYWGGDHFLVFTNGAITGQSVTMTNNDGFHDPIYQIDSSGMDRGLIQNNSPFQVRSGFVYTPPNGHWYNPKSLGIACGRPGAASCGEPIDIGSGNMFTEVNDYSTIGQNPLGFKRFYNSIATPNTYATSMGSNWRHNYDRYLRILNPSAIYGVTVERPDGQVINFSSNSGTYTTDSDIDYTLTKSGSTWTLTDPDDTIETYTASGEKGTLNSIKLRNGYTQAINYSSGQISYVSDSYSRQIGFTYSSAGLLTSITAPDAQTVSFSYVNFSSTNQNLLTSVSY
jgi:YD repeat-containing protein